MTNVRPTDLYELSRTIRNRWEANECVCCGAPLGHVWEDHATGNRISDVEIGADIKMCGLCVHKEHHKERGYVTSLILIVRLPDPRIGK